MTSRPFAADDFGAIRERMAALAREKNPALVDDSVDATWAYDPTSETIYLRPLKEAIKSKFGTQVKSDGLVTLPKTKQTAITGFAERHGFKIVEVDLEMMKP